MTELSITEAGSVQFPMVRHAAEIGWVPLSPSNTLALRGGEAGLLLDGERARERLAANRHQELFYPTFPISTLHGVP